ncbi:MAG: hypothetical protein IJ115_05975 [Erysipelotrichaceae bacterium]|nr:hypothetical protein [Erysipelotrichaceae bacterium]
MEELISIIEPIWDELSLFVVGTGLGFACNEIKKNSKYEYILKWNILMITPIILILALMMRLWN